MAIYLYETGAIYGTLYGYDSENNACGFNNLKNKNKAIAEGEALDNTGKDKRFCFNYDNYFGSVLGTADVKTVRCICVKSCPLEEHFERAGVSKEGVANVREFQKLEKAIFDVETEKLKTRNSTDLNPRDYSICESGTTDSEKWDESTYTKLGKCPKFSKSYYVTPTENFLNRCAEKSKSEAITTFAELIGQLDFIQGVVGTIFRHKSIIVKACGIAVGFSIVLIILLRFIAGIATYVITIGSSLLMIALSGFLWLLYFKNAKLMNYLENGDGDMNGNDGIFDTAIDVVQYDRNILLILAIVCSLAGALLMTCCFCMADHTEITIKCMKESSKILTKSPGLFIIPFLTFGCLVVFVSFWTFSFLTVIGRPTELNKVHIAENDLKTARIEAASALIPVKDAKIFENFKNFTLPNKTYFYDQDFLEPYRNYFIFFVIFALFWIYEFILACSNLLISSVASQTFNRNVYDNPYTGEKLGFCAKYCTVITSFFQVVIYHLGSAAFGSFIIALVWIPRAVLGYLQAKTKASQNKCLTATYSCLQCLFACFDKCLRHLSKSAYVFVVVDYKPFCISARKAFTLLAENTLQDVSISSMSWIFTFLSQVLVAACSATYVGMRIFNGNGNQQNLPDQDLDSLDSLTISDLGQYIYISAPIIITFISAYAIARTFFALYDMVLRTTLVMYLRAKKNGLEHDLPGDFKEMTNFVEDVRLYGGYQPHMGINGDNYMSGIEISGRELDR